MFTQILGVSANYIMNNPMVVNILLAILMLCLLFSFAYLLILLRRQNKQIAMLLLNESEKGFLGNTNNQGGRCEVESEEYIEQEEQSELHMLTVKLTRARQKIEEQNRLLENNNNTITNQNITIEDANEQIKKLQLEIEGLEISNSSLSSQVKDKNKEIENKEAKAASVRSELMDLLKVHEQIALHLNRINLLLSNERGKSYNDHISFAEHFLHEICGMIDLTNSLIGAVNNSESVLSDKLSLVREELSFYLKIAYVQSAYYRLKKEDVNDYGPIKELMLTSLDDDRFQAFKNDLDKVMESERVLKTFESLFNYIKTNYGPFYQQPVTILKNEGEPQFFKNVLEVAIVVQSYMRKRYNGIKNDYNQALIFNTLQNISLKPLNSMADSEYAWRIKVLCEKLNIGELNLAIDNYKITNQ